MTTPYIGSKISLISQLDIRYEGLLHKVDPVDSTISLSKVSSFGTEDRIANVIVPARKEVYDYIIFKASDIKDLIVCDTPKPAMPDVNDITYDPAIISVSKPVTGMLPSTDEHNVIQGSEASGPHPIAYRRVEMRHQIKEPKELPSNDHSLSGRFGQTARQQFYNQDAIQGQRQSHKFVSMRQEHSMPRVFQSQEHIPYQQQRPYHGNEHRHINDHRIHQHFYYNQHARASKKYEGDFDFEKANEDFLESVDDVFENIGQLDLERRDSQLSPTDKSSINEIDELTNNKAIMIHDKSNKNDVYYDKNRSFFDNISCDATERESGKDNKIDWKKERITNEITFGSSAVRLHNFHRHGSRGGAAHQHFRRGGYVYNQQRRYGAGPPGSNNRGSGDGYASKQYKERN